MPLRTHFRPDLHRKNCDTQISHANQIVGGAREGEDPIHLPYAPMAQLAQQRNGLQPAEAFFDALPFLLTDGVAWVPSRSCVNGASSRPLVVLGYMRGHVHVAALGNKTDSIKAFIPAYRDLMGPGNLLQHDHGRVTLRRSVRLENFRLDNQSVCVLHQQIAAVAQLGFFARAFARQLGLGIGVDSWLSFLRSSP